MSAAVLLQFALALLPLVQTAVPEFIAWLESLRSAAKQAGEWTDAQDANYRSVLFYKTNDPAYQPDP